MLRILGALEPLVGIVIIRSVVPLVRAPDPAKVRVVPGLAGPCMRMPPLVMVRSPVVLIVSVAATLVRSELIVAAPTVPVKAAVLSTLSLSDQLLTSFLVA